MERKSPVTKPVGIARWDANSGCSGSAAEETTPEATASPSPSRIPSGRHCLDVCHRALSPRQATHSEPLPALLPISHFWIPDAMREINSYVFSMEQKQRSGSTTRGHFFGIHRLTKWSISSTSRPTGFPCPGTMTKLGISMWVAWGEQIALSLWTL